MKIVQPIGTIAGSAISRIAVTLAEEFARAGHDSTLVVWNRDKIARAIDPRVNIVEASIVGVSRRNPWTKLLRLLVKPLLGPRLFLVAMAPLISRQLQKKVLDPGGYDVAILHAHSVFHLRHIHTPYLVVAHTPKSKQLLSGRWPWVDRLLISIYHRVYRNKPIACVSDGIRQDLIRHFALDPDRLSTLNNPFDIAGIRARAAQPPEGALPAKPYVIALGRNDPQKRFDRLLRAYALADIDEDLVILGRAAENPDLRQQVTALGLQGRVHFPGFKANPYPFIRAARLLVVASDYEGLPSTLIEALICATPVVSTDCPSGPREILTGKLANYLVPVEDEQALAGKIRQALAAPYPIEEPLVAPFEKQAVATAYLARLQQVEPQIR